MKKQILSILTLALISGIANAGYVVKVPLEMASGGSLPNGSIAIGAVSNGSGNGGTGGSGSESGSGSENEGSQDEAALGQQICDGKRNNLNAMHTFFGNGSVTSHSFVNRVCTINVALNLGQGPAETTCTNNGDGTSTYTRTLASEHYALDFVIENYKVNNTCVF
ncbi:hypothetical protein IPC755_28725 [Pseudomonas aeruginosa]|uniref:hypothetical protein n=1 Tax=Pseudomonas aeruginosa TaxID=287 RepID=UPI000FC3F848|nr:hypothetical protein [Pseudomonas aeruginosa]RUG38139.1 hypothetical protein IPC755_28725 [Pseudomonas aeruginosa]